MWGRPGTMAMPVMTTAAIWMARCWRRNWPMRSVPKSSSSVAARVTMMPVEMEIRRAGICETRPSPTLSRL